mgnify:CR=1 FL=1
MRKVFLMLIFLILGGCAQDRIAKPEVLMTSEQMINFHVDLALISASSSYAKDNFVSMDSLYAFHNIDSITFAQSNVYYASKPKLYTKIFESVKVQLTQLQEEDTMYELQKPLRKE